MSNNQYRRASGDDVAGVVVLVTFVAYGALLMLVLAGLRSCGSDDEDTQTYTTSTTLTTYTEAPVTTPVTTPEPEPEPEPEPATDYGTCENANSQGQGPYIEGVDVEYHFYVDRDEDGIVCERRFFW